MNEYKQLFNLGEVYATQSALNTFTATELAACVEKHAAGFWGNLPKQDKDANKQALKTGGRILSRYNLDGGNVYVITEYDRKTTTIMLVNEY